MFISHKYKVIFVHVQKTGGTSIRQLFNEYDPDLIEVIPLDPSTKRLKHCFASDIQLVIEDDIFKKYTKFCAVRNPLDRMLSWYYMLKHQTYSAPKVIRQDAANIAEALANAVDQQANNFDEFLMLPKDHPSGLFSRFYVNQLDYIATGGILPESEPENRPILVDKILKFENLNQEFADFAQEIGLDGKLPHINKITMTESKESYYTEQSRAIIGQRFQRDLDYFGYTI